MDDLWQKCSGNSLTTILEWTGDGGCDLDICIKILDEKYGWSFLGEGIYGQHYGDDTGCGGTQKVSFNRQAISGYCVQHSMQEVQIIVKAHWYSSYESGNFTLKASSPAQIKRETLNTMIQQGSGEEETYQHVLTIYYNPFTETFRFVKPVIIISGAAVDLTMIGVTSLNDLIN